MGIYIEEENHTHNMIGLAKILHDLLQSKIIYKY